ncbi:glycosyltransferase family 2 protein [Trametes versicolor FP-101664 SS1]|uniref:glycosyltransferase family 2 protein n=1 Tax=Trametes versicolor (strain FP-101664) TaxID=717944 RepID=UPI0004624445|nr:glycosyltransferase family 2 protein [Trametes versicolor FP-101664 SS1]EIW62202.1 glycosyltransferase family 2 protein [Trametes versicolor FP-101664 SS1]
MLSKEELILITGGHGFIGGHISRRLVGLGYRLRVVDIVPEPPFNAPRVGEVVIGNLCDPTFAARVVQGVGYVLHFAATMGGMGTIHASNDFIIYRENHLMTVNLVDACTAAGVRGFFYASSACVYPESLQIPGSDVSLAESDVWKNPPPRPQGLYGLEKLASELVLEQHRSHMEVRIARFHNVFGPLGSWYGGREKVPAAFLRKAFAVRLSEAMATTFEVWGDGSQRRSFCFIDDAVEAVLRLLGSDCNEPVNVGSDQAVSIQQLANMALAVAGVDPASVSFEYKTDRPVGVGSRNSNNAFARWGLGWTPEHSLEKGMRITGEWIHSQMVQMLSTMDDAERHRFLRLSQTSDMVDLQTDAITFAILLPCDYYVLMGDDVVLQDANWMSTIHHKFGELAEKEHVPHGIGCVAFTDTSFPGMPTFPAIHRTHMDIFGGQVVPDCFTNQDGDPFLFQLYRRWGCASMIASRIHNKLGGSEAARYEKVHATGWTFQPLDNATKAVEDWLRRRAPGLERKLALDVVVPCYRVDMRPLDRFLALQQSPTLAVMFIIIVDDPNSPRIGDLTQKYGSRPDVRIRVNAQNLGASASRNRGLLESAAEWVVFLDDDVLPDDSLLLEAEKAIRAHPKAVGFVGNAQFPIADSVFTAAVHLAGVTYFWDIAEKIKEDVPWGVTANLIARRNVPDDVQYDLQFPKTGGGEDIDYCRKKRAYSLKHGGEGFWGAPAVKVTHPWWNGGRRSYWRFYMWSKGDGGLIRLYPEYSYRDALPNAAECLLLCGVLLAAGCGIALLDASLGLRVAYLAFLMVLSVVIAAVTHDLARHLVLHPERVRRMKTTVSGALWVIAITEGTLLRVFSEWGRVVGILERGEYGMLLKRFDWFCGRWGDGPKGEELRNNKIRLVLAVAIFGVLVAFVRV